MIEQNWYRYLLSSQSQRTLLISRYDIHLLTEQTPKEKKKKRRHSKGLATDLLQAFNNDEAEIHYGDRISHNNVIFAITMPL